MKCNACGADLPPNSASCEFCGESVASAAPAPASSAPASVGSGSVGSGATGSGGSPLSGYAAEKRQGAKFALAGVAVLCALGGVAALFASSRASALKAKVGVAMLRTAEEALDTDGLVCVEATAAQIDQPYRIPGTEIDCLYVQEKRERREKRRSTSSRTSSSSSGSSKTKTRTTTTTNEHAVPVFKLGPLTVNTSGASYQATRRLHHTEDRAGQTRTTVTWTGIEAGVPVTVIGQAHGGTISGGEPFMITPLTSKQALLDHLQSGASTMKLVGIVLLIVGLLVGGGSVVAFRKG